MLPPAGLPESRSLSCRTFITPQPAPLFQKIEKNGKSQPFSVNFRFFGASSSVGAVKLTACLN
jgi:hypothetical protein